MAFQDYMSAESAVVLKFVGPGFTRTIIETIELQTFSFSPSLRR